jgi:malate dehydrogenase
MFRDQNQPRLCHLLKADEQAFVFQVIPDLPFFASRVKLGRLGVEAVLPLEGLSEYEQKALEKLKPELKASIEKGIAFVKEKAEASA